MKKPGLCRACWFSSDLIVAAVSSDSGCPDHMSALYIYIPPFAKGAKNGAPGEITKRAVTKSAEPAGEEKVHPILRRTRKMGAVIVQGRSYTFPCTKIQTWAPTVNSGDNLFGFSLPDGDHGSGGVGKDTEPTHVRHFVVFHHHGGSKGLGLLGCGLDVVDADVG